MQPATQQSRIRNVIIGMGNAQVATITLAHKKKKNWFKHQGKTLITIITRKPQQIKWDQECGKMRWDREERKRMGAEKGTESVTDAVGTSD